MPELPEVETVMRGIETRFNKARIIGSETYRPNIRFQIPSDFNALCQGQSLLSLERRSKYILMHLGNNYSVIVHLGMSGQMLIKENFNKNHRDAHMHWVCDFDNDYSLIFRDPRRFGVLDIAKSDRLSNHRLLKDIGPEPFSKAFTVDYLYENLQRSKSPIKSALLNQKLVAGLGNIYVCEALFLAGIHPKRRADKISFERTKSLYTAIIQTLEKAIKAGGSSLKDFRHADGSLGYFQHQFLVYDREAHTCPHEDGGIIKRITQSGRSSFYCPVCQR